MMTAFGRDGAAAHLLTLVAGGLTARVTDHGATLVGLDVPDRHGEPADVVLGFDDLAGYGEHADAYLGATIGRVANRIAGASFTLDGRVHRLEANEPPHHLHGGPTRGFDRVRWAIAAQEPDAVVLTHASPAGDAGYPGRVEATASYRLTADALVVEYAAETDAPTPVGMTNHAYWNLAGAGTVLDHVLQVAAAAHTPVDEDLIPTGAVADVAGTPLDFRRPRRLGERIEALRPTPALGYDHNLVLDGGPGVRFAARLHDPASGRVLELRTDQPCLQLYSGNKIPDPLPGKAGAVYGRHSGLCLEPQPYPDAVHHPGFPSVVLQPGQVYRHRSEYRFPTA